MALLVECPRCKNKQSTRARKCRECEINLTKVKSKTYYIDFYNKGRRIRERVGTSKKLAEQHQHPCAGNAPAQKQNSRYFKMADSGGHHWVVSSRILLWWEKSGHGYDYVVDIGQWDFGRYRRRHRPGPPSHYSVLHSGRTADIA